MNPKVITLDGASPDEPPVMRAYRHFGCGCETAAAGDALVLLECAFRPVESTLCAGCGQYAPLDEVAWSDSCEIISEYRERVYSSVTFWQRMYFTWLGNAYEGALNLNLDRNGKLKDESPSLVS